ncbi:hypothetical protein NDJ66_03970 [Escherichia coli]|uniref:hypothetical protein n=1 Tax=Escherichia coli TaxID=562 RepID=UPI0020C82B44|nr:hypothetical protein [Escherichia coli]MCP8769829.1 hypothetical protein [Escherichia coli]MCP8769840.1 hypothetical protein [Escherichia coli]
MAEKKYTSLRVPEERKMELEKAAIEVSYATGRMVKWTDMAFYLMDEYLKEAVQRHEVINKDTRPREKIKPHAVPKPWETTVKFGCHRTPNRFAAKF